MFFSTNTRILRNIFLMTGLFLAVLFLSGCGNSTSTNKDTQAVSFSDYSITIPNDYIAQGKDNLVDARISDHILGVYAKGDGMNFSDNIIISQDKVSPSISLDDYVQAAIGGIEYTRGKYKSLYFKKDTILCNATQVPTITNSFSIYRITPKGEAETLYFVHYYIHRLDEIISISATTNNEKNLSSLEDVMTTTSCNTVQK